jgi:hypothetical protein
MNQEGPMDMPKKPRPPNPNPNPSNSYPSPLSAAIYAPTEALLPGSVDPRRRPTSCAAKAGLRQCWATTLVVKGFLFAVGFTFLALEFNCWENYDDGNIYDYRNSTNYHCGFSGPNPPVYGASIFAANISSLQVVLGMYATSVVCWPPHTRLMSDYIVWIILTLCEVPGFVAGWAYAIYIWTDYRSFYDPSSSGATIGVTVPAIALVTSFLIVTATLTHSFRARN